MPQVTVYVRNEDLEEWKAIEKKSQWIHEKLGGKPKKVRYARQGDPRKGEPAVVELGNSITGYQEPYGVGEIAHALDKRNPDVQALIDAWESEMGKLHGKQAENRKYAHILIKRKDIGLDRAVGAIKAFKAIKGQKYSPKIVDIQSLYRKWADLEDFYLRKKADDEDPDRELTQEELNREFNL